MRTVLLSEQFSIGVFYQAIDPWSICHNDMVCGSLGFTPHVDIPIVEVRATIHHECFWGAEHMGDNFESIKDSFRRSAGSQLETPCEAGVCVEDK